ncbi:hypothetical protein M885DRAFT_75689 [Pelagophyceae sp. CCMP2097]|nr:hypothetical protein M885DRAFT_75689 [Pelagophyceae sp. CCMP2097]
MHGVSAPADAARDAAAAEAAQVAYAGPAHEGDARGGFGHTMMEQFEALRKQGYTVLMGEAGDRDAAPAPAPAAAPAAALNYERFENIGDSESDDDGADFGEVEAAPKVSADTTALWEAVLSLAGGDVAAARELLADPDALQRRPEIQALYEDAA